MPETFTISVRQGSTVITDYTYEYVDGYLSVYVEGTKVNVGDSVTTVVTVSTENGTAESECKIAPPSLDNVTMTAEKMAGGGYTFRIVANVSPDDANEMYCWAELSINFGDSITVDMTKASDGTYVGSYYAADLTGSGEADVYVYGDWMGYEQLVTIPDYLHYGP